MAQILKDTVRENILNAALDEMYEKGIENASMRSIADRAGMTVGNLYRYYPNKDELVSRVLEPAIKRTSEIFESVSENQISFALSSFFISYTKDIVKRKIDDISGLIIPVLQKYPVHMKILLSDRNRRENFENWLFGLTKVLLKYREDRDISENGFSVLAKMISSSLTQAITVLITSYIEDETEMKKLMNIYLHSAFAII